MHVRRGGWIGRAAGATRQIGAALRRQRSGMPAFLRPPNGLLARVRWIFLLAGLLASLIPAFILPCASTRDWWLRPAGEVALLLLCIRLVRYYRRGDAPVLSDAAEAPLPLLVVLVVGPMLSLGVLYFTLYLRSLAASIRRVVFRTAVCCAAFAGADVVPPHMPISFFLECIIGMPIVAAMMAFVGSAAARYERAIAREQLLRTAGSRLLAACDRACILAVATEACADLLGDVPGAQAYLALREGDDFVVCRPTDDRLAGAAVRCTFADLPDRLQRALLAGQPLALTRAENLALHAALRHARPVAFVYVQPLVLERQCQGTITVAGDVACPSEITHALAVLATQISLALAKVKLTEDLRAQALHDDLTGLPNRTLLQDRLHQAIEDARRTRTQLALCLLDLDRFKDVNDTLGHATGDMLLREVSRHLRRVVAATDTVARLGGDEFAILVPVVTTVEQIDRLAARVIAAVGAPLGIVGVTIQVGVSIGIALYPAHGEDARALLQHADVAMYAAKRSGAGYALYRQDHDPNSPQRLMVLSQPRTPQGGREDGVAVRIAARCETA